jgi:PAS domain S-box-containing protein
MLTLANYDVSSTIYESGHSIIYRGQRKTDRRPVVLKLIKADYPTSEQIARFTREYELLRRLSGEAELPLPGVIAAYALETDQQRTLIAFEDFGGGSLAQLKLAGTIGLADFLQLAIRIVAILGQIHQRQIIHKDINPANIVLNPATDEIKIIDFGISSILSRENPTLRNPNVLEGTLAYISPEQTGRMNRAIDYRTDFYSLGVTFYELLTGRLPFISNDPLELVHAHLAQQPTPPHINRPEIPPAVSAIIMRLMTKNAESRYQSAQGIKADLEACLRQLQENGRIDEFALGQSDSSDRFQIAQKLYGREAEIATLLAAFERVAAVGGSVDSPDGQGSGKSELLLVAGSAGIGKSALVQELYQPITHRRGYFTAGKFDQFQRNIPYSALIQCFQALIRQLLTESEAEIAGWRAELVATLGANGQIIVDVIPEVALIIGQQAEVPELSPAEAHNRFNLTFQSFINVFAQSRHPLVIFLDDLQWADGASLKLLELLMLARASRHLLLIGSYRDNEVGEADPLMLTLAAIRSAEITLSQIALAPLQQQDVVALIADTLKRSPAEVTSLATLVVAKTAGNPFFLTEFLKALYQEELIRFDYASGRWQWSLREIQGHDITDNVVDLMARKVTLLPAETHETLNLAACIGNHFDLATLALVAGQPPQQVAAQLWPALIEGLVLPLSDSYRLMDLEIQNLAVELGAEYKFAHDRVQQAVYSLLSAEQRQEIHLKVGRQLRQSTPPEEQEHAIFAIVNQLNFAIPILDRPERADLVRLNLLAGKKAKSSAAYGPAFSYLQTGIDLLGADAWAQTYPLALDLHVEAAEAAYLSGDFARMDELIAPVLDLGRSALDKAKAYDVHINGLMAQNNPPGAIETALQALELLGVAISAQPTPEDIGGGLMKTQAAWADRSIEALADLPPMADPEKLAAMRIISTVMPITYVANPALVPMFALAMVDLSLAYGNAPASTFGYATYGLVLISALGEINAGYLFGQLAMDLLDRLDAREFKARTYFYVYLFTTHGKRHLRETLAPSIEAYRSGLETGDIANSALTAMLYGYHAYVAGKELRGLNQEMLAYSQAMRQLKQDFALLYNELYRHAVVSWIEPGSAPNRPLFEDYYAPILPSLLETQNFSAAWIVYLNRLIFNYAFGQYPAALAAANDAEPFMAAGAGAVTLPIFYFYDSLVRLALYSTASEAERPTLLARVAANQERLRPWAENGPMNYLHKVRLVEAEQANALGEHSKARELYDQAIDLALEHDYINEAALAYELAGRFYLSLEQIRMARYCLRDAHQAYQRWGAQVKVDALQLQYPQLLSKATKGSTTLSTSLGSATTVSNVLDLSSVLKASQAISGEIVLGALLSRMMRLVMENAGAQRGILLLNGTSGLTIEASGDIDQEIAVLQSIPLAQAAAGPAPLLPSTIVNYVARTHDSVVLNNAAGEGGFANDSYIASRQPRSILCVPLLNQSRLAGILYLENNLTSDAFTTDRIEILRLLSAQIAISVENASLYTNLERSEKKYRTLFEDSKDTIFITTPDGMILDINPAGSALLGYSRAELMAMNAQQLYVAGENREHFILAMQQYGQVRDFEVKFRRRDNTQIECLITATAREATSSSPALYEGIIRDVTAKKAAEKERIRFSALQRELDVAHNIQISLLPPARPGWSGLDMLCYNAPSREVGGDLYAYHALGTQDGTRPAERFVLAVGDVSGKGMPAALLMAVSLASLQSIIEQGFAPNDLLSYLDRAIMPYTRTTRQNCALVYAEVIPPASADGQGTLRVANAGCVTPLIRRADGSVEWADVGGLPLGIALGPRAGYEMISLPVAQGDIVILSSDGVIEAMNPAGELFGFTGLEAAARQGPGASAEAMLSHLRAAVTAFTQGAEAHDDLTLVVAQI